MVGPGRFELPACGLRTWTAFLWRERSGRVRVCRAWQLCGPCAVRVLGRQVPFSQVACATWRDIQLLCLCFPIPRDLSEVSGCELLLLLRHHERAGTSAPPGRVPSFRASQPLGPYVHSQRGKYSIAASLSAFQRLPVRDPSIRVVVSNALQSPWSSPFSTKRYETSCGPLLENLVEGSRLGRE
jgi:hypothetical protein